MEGKVPTQRVESHVTCQAQVAKAHFLCREPLAQSLCL
jgi:hypothetical protein